MLGIEVDLGSGRAVTHQDTFVDCQMNLLREFTCEICSLVESSSAQTMLVQRDRHDNVNRHRMP